MCVSAFFRELWGSQDSLAFQVLKGNLDLLVLQVFQELKEFKGQR